MMMSESAFKQVKLSENNIKEIAIANKTNPYTDVLPFHLNMGYPLVKYTGLLLRPHEFMLYATPAQVYKEKEKFMGYTGNSSGVSFRLAKGVWLRTGGSRGRPVREKVREFTKGDLIITNERIVFLAPANGFEIKIKKLLSCQPIATDALVLQAGNVTKNIYIERTEVLRYVYACTNASMSSAIKGYDLYEENENLKKAVTPEMEEEYEKAKAQVAKIHVPDLSKQSLGESLKKVLVYACVIFLIILFLRAFKAQ